MSKSFRGNGEQRPTPQAHPALATVPVSLPAPIPERSVPGDPNGVWFRIAKVPKSGGNVALEKLEVRGGAASKLSEVHTEDLLEITIGKLHHAVLEELSR